MSKNEFQEKVLEYEEWQFSASVYTLHSISDIEEFHASWAKLVAGLAFFS